MGGAYTARYSCVPGAAGRTRTFTAPVVVLAAGSVPIPAGFYTSTPMHIDTAGRLYTSVISDRIEGQNLPDARLVKVGSEGVALVYTASAQRDSEDEPFVALMSSVYRRGAGGWRLALYQQTPIPAG